MPCRWALKMVWRRRLHNCARWQAPSGAWQTSRKRRPHHNGCCSTWARTLRQASTRPSARLTSCGPSTPTSAGIHRTSRLMEPLMRLESWRKWQPEMCRTTKLSSSRPNADSHGLKRRTPAWGWALLSYMSSGKPSYMETQSRCDQC